MILGMRMHANILAATQFVPYVAIAYEHKTTGISEMIGMRKYCIWDKEVKERNIYRLLEYVYDQRPMISRKLKKNVKVIQTNASSHWIKLLRTA